jgi:uncharacterized protein YaaR (DUF327 family)
MESTITVETDAPTQEELIAIAVNRIIEQSSRLSRDRTIENVWRDVYEPAKRAIGDFNLSTEDYQAAIARLTEAMSV